MNKQYVSCLHVAKEQVGETGSSKNKEVSIYLYVVVQLALEHEGFELPVPLICVFFFINTVL